MWAIELLWIHVGIMSNFNADNELMISALIEIRCSTYLLENYASLEEAFKGFNYYVQVRGCDENYTTKGRRFKLDLCKDHDDVYDK